MFGQDFSPTCLVCFVVAIVACGDTQTQTSSFFSPTNFSTENQGCGYSSISSEFGPASYVVSMRVTNDCARDQVVNWIGPGPTEQITELNVEHLVLGGDGISGYQNFEDANGVQTPGRCLTLISDDSAAGVQPDILSKKSLIVPAGLTPSYL